MIARDLFPDDFFLRSSIDVAPDLLGAKLCFQNVDGLVQKFTISETEAYHGTEDLASHARRRIDSKCHPMFGPPNHWYLYLCYGVHWMLNLVTAEQGEASAVFFRSTLEVQGPGKLTQKLGLDKSLNGMPNQPSSNLWLEKPFGRGFEVRKGPRIGVSGAGPIWGKVPYRFWFSKST